VPGSTTKWLSPGLSYKYRSAPYRAVRRPRSTVG